VLAAAMPTRPGWPDPGCLQQQHVFHHVQRQNGAGHDQPPATMYHHQGQLSAAGAARPEYAREGKWAAPRSPAPQAWMGQPRPGRGCGCPIRAASASAITAAAASAAGLPLRRSYAARPLRSSAGPGMDQSARRTAPATASASPTRPRPTGAALLAASQAMPSIEGLSIRFVKRATEKPRVGIASYPRRGRPARGRNRVLA